MLFQLFNGLSLSIDNDCDVVFSNTTSSITKRKQENIWFETLFSFIDVIRNKPKIDKVYNENGFNYKKIQKIPNNKTIEIKGYYQSEKYFQHNKESIIPFILETFDDNIKKHLLTKINYDNTCSVHIRRSDYLKLQHCHVVQNNDYYIKAINKMKKKVDKDCKFIIFSDDYKFCKNNPLFKDYLFGDDIINDLRSNINTNLSDDLLEMFLMSLTHHNIIGNSTFSWWGSYLNQNQNKIVIAPKQWFNPKGGPKNWDDIYTKDMIIL